MKFSRMRKRKIAIVGNAPGGNYRKAVLALLSDTEIASDGVVHVDIEHDPWCALVVSGALCDCNPHVTRRVEP